MIEFLEPMTLPLQVAAGVLIAFTIRGFVTASDEMKETWPGWVAAVLTVLVIGSAWFLGAQ